MQNSTMRKVGPTGLVAVLVALSVALFGVGAGSASAANNPGRLHTHAKHVKASAPVTGLTAAGQRVRAEFVPKSLLVNSGGQLVARGILVGKILKPGRDTHFRKAVAMPVSAVDGRAVTSAVARQSAAAAFPPAPAAGACNVLNLVLAPLDLNLLGLQVHLDQVVLNIVAQSGAGQLLGNLLCFVAGLLDGGGPLAGLLTQLTGLLNQILGALGGVRA